MSVEFAMEVSPIKLAVNVHQSEKCAHGPCVEVSQECSCGREVFPPHFVLHWHGRNTSTRGERSVRWLLRYLKRLTQKCEASHGIH